MILVSPPPPLGGTGSRTPAAEREGAPTPGGATAPAPAGAGRAPARRPRPAGSYAGPERPLRTRGDSRTPPLNRPNHRATGRGPMPRKDSP